MIEARELTKRYGSTLAVDRMSFQVRPGHVTGFLGPNGAGKSTTMRMILGLDAPTSGEVVVNGGRYLSLMRPLHEVGALLDANVPIATRARDLLASEWTKLRSVRSTYVALLGSAAAAVAVGIFSAATVKTSHIDPATFDPVQTSLAGLLVVQLAFGVFGALAITSEHATGMIRTTFAAVPRRRAVLAAKATVTATAGLAAGEMIAFAAFFAGQLVLSGKHLQGKQLNVTLADTGVLRAVTGAGFYLFIVTLVGLGLGVIIRHTAGAIAAVGLIFIQALIVNAVFPDPDSAAGHYVLLWAGQSISSIRAHVTSYPSPGQSFAVCVAYAAVLLATASFLITRRDA